MYLVFRSSYIFRQAAAGGQLDVHAEHSPTDCAVIAVYCVVHVQIHLSVAHTSDLEAYPRDDLTICDVDFLGLIYVDVKSFETACVISGEWMIRGFPNH